jgi:uncharacterized protein (DUF1810 family)
MSETDANDPYNLWRFVEAQGRVYEEVLSELRAGYKSGHWMWFVFPQIAGLGRTPTSRLYAISGRAEAEAYLAHPVLGPRLRECTRLVNSVEGASAEDIFGYTDSRKFRSSMTLFAHATTDDQIFWDALRRYFGGDYDYLTLERLAR